MQKTRLQLIPASLLKYSYGTVQLTVNPASTVAELIRGLQLSISKYDLMAKGMEDEFHVTVRYGIQDDETDGIQKYLNNVRAFSITFGATKVFPPSGNSDNAAVVYVEVISPELEKINDDLGSVGNFKTKDFVYHPHLTLAYVNPDAAYKYEGMTGVQGFSYEVTDIEVRTKDKEDDPVIVALSKAVVAKFGKWSVYLPRPKLNERIK